MAGLENIYTFSLRLLESFTGFFSTYEVARVQLLLGSYACAIPVPRRTSGKRSIFIARVSILLYDRLAFSKTTRTIANSRLHATKGIHRQSRRYPVQCPAQKHQKLIASQKRQALIQTM